MSLPARTATRCVVDSTTDRVPAGSCGRGDSQGGPDGPYDVRVFPDHHGSSREANAGTLSPVEPYDVTC